MSNFLKKKTNLSKITAIFVLLLFIVLYACEKEFSDSSWEEEKIQVIDRAKARYEMNKPDEIILRSSGEGNGKMKIKAEWSHAFATRYDSLEVVETDVISEGRIFFLLPECVQKYEETNDPKCCQCYTRMVFRTDKATGDTVGFLMTVVPNLDWLEKSKFKPFHDVTYLFRSKQFGGMILFHNLDGSFSNGWQYEKGKIVTEISSLDADSSQVPLRYTTCSNNPVYTVFSYCIGMNTGGEDDYLGPYMEICYSQPKITSYVTECIDWGDPGSTNNNNNNYPPPGGGGYIPVTPPSLPPTPTPKPLCVNATKTKSNPLLSMELAPPSTSNIAGATYGNTRTYGGGIPKFHDGIDLSAGINTPISAMFDGFIANTPVTEQPNRTNNEYPSTYTGDKNGAGNRITVRSAVGGKTVDISYWHLRAGSPIGTNPRTGQPWQPGDVVYMGEIVGYTGITGNANPYVPHLHLNIKVDGTKANPESYLNATVSKSSVAITTPCN